MEPAVYSAEIRVLDKDERTARELLNGLVPEEYHPKSKLARKMLSLRWFWYIVIIILFIIILIGFLYLIK